MLTKYNPLRSFGGFDLSPIYSIWGDDTSTATWPERTDPFDIKTRETDTEHLIRIAAPGFEKDEVKVEISDNMISIRGEKNEQNDEWNFSGTFSRSFTLPSNIMVDKIKGELKNGILLITIPKKEKYVKKIALE